MARIVRAAAARERRIDASVVAARRRAAELVAAAEASAREIVARAEAERARVQAEAAAAGHAEGLARAAGSLAEAAQARDRVLAAAGREVAELALDVAARILGRELDRDPAAVADLAARALDAARGRRRVVVRACPSDAAALRDDRRLAAALAGPGVELREDPDVAPGGVVVETEAGRVDARVAAQLEALRRALDGEGR